MGITLSSVFSRFFFSKKPVRILMLGLPSAGKTTILYQLKLGEIVTIIPTIGFNVETVEYKNISFTIWDVGGGSKMMLLWKHYFTDTDGLIYVVDISNREEIETAKFGLHNLLEEDLSCPLLVFANKQDLPNTMSIAELTDKLGLNSFRNGKWHVQAACATEGKGLLEGLDWLSNELAA